MHIAAYVVDARSLLQHGRSCGISLLVTSLQQDHLNMLTKCPHVAAVERVVENKGSLTIIDLVQHVCTHNYTCKT